MSTVCVQRLWPPLLPYCVQSIHLLNVSVLNFQVFRIVHNQRRARQPIELPKVRHTIIFLYIFLLAALLDRFHFFALFEYY